MYLFETLLKYTVLVLSVDPPLAAMVKGELIIGAVANKSVETGRLFLCCGHALTAGL